MKDSCRPKKSSSERIVAHMMTFQTKQNAGGNAVIFVFLTFSQVDGENRMCCELEMKPEKSSCQRFVPDTMTFEN